MLEMTPKQALQIFKDKSAYNCLDCDNCPLHASGCNITGNVQWSCDKVVDKAIDVLDKLIERCDDGI